MRRLGHAGRHHTANAHTAIIGERMKTGLHKAAGFPVPIPPIRATAIACRELPWQKKRMPADERRSVPFRCVWPVPDQAALACSSLRQA